MDNKKIIMYFSILIIIVMLGSIGYYIFNKIKTKSEIYIPQEEISNSQLRQTAITLYFGNKEGTEIIPEIRRIDSKVLINYPYEELINLLIEGPINENLIKLIPQGTKLINTKIENDILYLNFSSEIIGNTNIKKEMIIKSIVNTLTQFTEINKVCFLIDGKENEFFYDSKNQKNKIYLFE